MIELGKVDWIMACVQFVAPTVGRRLKTTDVIVVQTNTGRKAGSLANSFTGVRPVFMANLITRGKFRPASIELIPLKTGSVRIGTRLTGFEAIGNRLPGEDFVPKYLGKVSVSETIDCGCMRRKTVSKIVKQSLWQR